MKLLICTQTVDSTDPHLGFFHSWIEEFAKHCEEVSVVCLNEGECHLPSNVKIYALGKGNKITRAIRFWRYMYALRTRYDAIFVHMNPEYLLLGGPYWRMTGRKVVLWYAHKSITIKLRVGTWFTTAICSVTKKSFPIGTTKLHPVGHGIDTNIFTPVHRAVQTEALQLVTVSRIAESKHLLEMLDVIDVLKKRNIDVHLTIAGEAGTEEERAYKQRLLNEIESRELSSHAQMIGGIPHSVVPQLLAQHETFLNFSTTGNMDKAGFEPLVMGMPLISTNMAFKELLSPYGLYVEAGNPEAIADAILRARTLDTAALMEEVRQRHSLERLIPKLMPYLKS